MAVILLTAALQGSSTTTSALHKTMRLGATLVGGARMAASETLQFEVVSVEPVNPFTLLVTTFPPPNLNLPQIRTAANWSASGGLTVKQVLPSGDPNTVRVILGQAQSFQGYTITFAAATNSGSFTGYSTDLRFSARPLGPTSINLVFAQPMQVNGALTNPASYDLRTLDGQSVVVQSATPNTVSDPLRVTLQTAPLASGVPYTLTLSADLRTSSGASLHARSTTVHWHRTARKTSVPLSKFTGEVRAKKNREETLLETLALFETLSVVVEANRNERPETPAAYHEVLTLQESLTVVGSGMDTTTRHAVSVSEVVAHRAQLAVTALPDGRSTFEVSLSESLTLSESLKVTPEEQTGVDPSVSQLFGNPDGMVFFSPALKTGGAPNSSIQVDEVKACTTTYDTYHFPQPIDPIPLYTHGLGITPTPEVTLLNEAVLITDFYRLKEARFDIGMRPEDTVTAFADGGLSVVMTQVYPPAQIALLNNPAWALFAAGAPPPFLFITADNSIPIPAPVVAPKHYFVNPLEVLTMQESVTLLTTTGVDVADTLTHGTSFDLAPGENDVQVNESVTLTLTENLDAQVGLGLSETLTLVEGLSVV